MLYDVILALFGHLGDVVVESDDKERMYKLKDEIKLSKSERTAINAILKTGHIYNVIKNFCDKIGNNDYYSDLNLLFMGNNSNTLNSDLVNDSTTNLGTKNLVNSNGYYMSALCNGIQEYLTDYRQLLLKLEEVATSSTVLPTSTFAILMKDQNKIFHCIHTIILDYEYAAGRFDKPNAFLKSGDLIEILSKKTNDKIVKDIYKKLRTDVLSFLKFQLRNWLCSGHLLDPYGEFVISYRDLKSINTDSQIPLNTFHSDHSNRTNYHSRLLEYEWNYKFYIKLNKSATFGPIDYKTSKSILFIGKVIRMLSRSLSDFSTNKTGLTSNFYANNLIQLADKHIFSVWDKISIDKDKFSTAIENYRLYVSSLFRDFIDSNFNIMFQLRLFKDVFLLGYDSIYNNFFEETYDHMIKGFNESSFKMVNNEFIKAISAVSTRSSNNSSSRMNMFGRLDDKASFDSKDGTSRQLSIYKSNGTLSNDLGSFNFGYTKETSSFSNESMKMEQIMGNYEMFNTQITTIKDEDSFEMFKYINDFNINSNFIKINNIKHDDSFVIGSDSSIWYEQMVYILTSFNISFVVNLKKIKDFKQFAVLLSSSYFKSFNGDQQPNESEKTNLRFNFKNTKKNNSILKKTNEISQVDDVKEYICIEFKIANDNGNLDVSIKIMYNNIYNNNNMKNRNAIISSKKQTFKYDANADLILDVSLEFNKSSLRVNLREFKEKLNETTTYYSIDTLSHKSFSADDESAYNPANEEYDEFEDLYEEEGEYDNNLNRSRLFFKNNTLRSYQTQLKYKNINEKGNPNKSSTSINGSTTNSIGGTPKNGSKYNSASSGNVESHSEASKISNSIEVDIEVKSFDIIELLKLISDSLYVGIINHTPANTNSPSGSNATKANASSNKPNSSFNSKAVKETKKISFGNSVSKESTKSTSKFNANGNGSAANRPTKSFASESSSSSDDDSIELLIYDYYTILNKYDLLPYYKVQQFKNNNNFTLAVNSVVKKAGDESLSEVGVNEWIYVLLNYKYKYINFINIKSYNNIFQIIFTMKRCLYGLEKRSRIDSVVRKEFTRYQLSNRAKAKDTADSASNTTNSIYECSELFRKLYCFKYYLQTNLKLILAYFYNVVIEPKYDELQEFVTNSNDFQIIKTKHHLYIENILRKCVCDQFIMYSLFQCLDISFKFNYILNSIGDISKLNSTEIVTISENIDKMREVYLEYFPPLVEKYHLHFS